MIEAKVFDLSTPSIKAICFGSFAVLPRVGEFIKLADEAQGFRVFEVKMVVHGNAEPGPDIYVEPAASQRPWMNLLAPCGK